MRRRHIQEESLEETFRTLSNDKELIEENLDYETATDRGDTKILQAMKIPRNTTGIVKEEQSTGKDNKQTVMDAQNLFQKFFYIFWRRV